MFFLGGFILFCESNLYFWCACVTVLNIFYLFINRFVLERLLTVILIDPKEESSQLRH